MNIPLTSQIFRKGFIERGAARVFGGIFTADIPGTLFGEIPPKKIDCAVKNLFKCKTAEGLKKRFTFPNIHPVGAKNLQRKIDILTDCTKQILSKRQDYIAIPAVLYVGHKALCQFTKSAPKQKNHFQKIIECGVKEIHNYTQKFINQPILASLAISGAIYGGTKLLNKPNQSKVKQQETINETL